ncbi:MAG: hypothetical protein H0W86_02525 [Armatimonadetes bacterium]|nr:hypothetical protein [Armatimonadota bacterium]
MERGYPRWFWLLAAATLFLSAAPYLFALAIQPEGTLYLGVHSNYDDHAVYAAWTKQAQEGRFFFENLFTTDPQPGLTVNLYFWTTGTLSRLTGIPLAMHLAKAVFGLLFLMSLYGLARRLSESQLVRFTAMATTIFGAGVGWLVWRRYGHEGPIDVWQPEAFTFPSLMQNGLFCAALWLICVIWNKILDARDSWKSVLPGFVAMLVLTNIHTYDTLTIAIVAAGFLATQVGAKQATPAWVGRAATIALGAIPPLLWFVYVRANDPVFAQRGETPTLSAPFANVLLGYAPLLLLAMVAFWRWGRDAPGKRSALQLVLAVAGMFLIGSVSENGQLSPWWWIPIAAVAIAVCSLNREARPVRGLLFAWTLLGIVALYYPGLFQRKLGMGLSIPIGLCAGWAIGTLAGRLKGRERILAAAVTIAAVSITSARWLFREALMAADNTSNTTVQNVFWDTDVERILNYLRANKTKEDAVLAMPGLPISTRPDSFQVAIPDLNPVLSGWAGVRSWASHWSETPHYVDRRRDLSIGLYSQGSTPESARTLIEKSKATFIVAPKGESADLLGVQRLAFFGQLGRIVYEGDRYILIEVSGPAP